MEAIINFLETTSTTSQSNPANVVITSTSGNLQISPSISVSSSASFTTGGVAGVAIGAIVVVVLSILAVVYLARRSSRKTHQQPKSELPIHSDTSSPVESHRLVDSSNHVPSNNVTHLAPASTLDIPTLNFDDQQEVSIVSDVDDTEHDDSSPSYPSKQGHPNNFNPSTRSIDHNQGEVIMSGIDMNDDEVLFNSNPATSLTSTTQPYGATSSATSSATTSATTSNTAATANVTNNVVASGLDITGLDDDLQ